MAVAALRGVGREQRRDAAAGRAGDDDAGSVGIDGDIDGDEVGTALDGVADQPRGVRLLVDPRLLQRVRRRGCRVQPVDERQQVGPHELADAARVGVVAHGKARVRTRSLRSARRSRPSGEASS